MSEELDEMLKKMRQIPLYPLPKLNSKDGEFIIYSLDRDWALAKIEDEDLKTHIGDDELEYIVHTVDLITEIHRKRGPGHYKMILDGYFAELNRAISQGNDDEEKVEMLKQYCEDVEKQIRENASDLMVMHDE